MSGKFDKDTETVKRICFTAVTFISSYMAGKMAQDTFDKPEKQTPLNWFLVFSSVGANLVFLWNLWYHAMKGRKMRLESPKRYKQAFGIAGLR